MTTEPTDLDSLRATLAKMTPGEWTAESALIVRNIQWGVLTGDGMACVCTCHPGLHPEGSAAANANGIVAIHNALPSLLDEVESLRLRRFTVRVLPESPDQGPPKKYTVECHGKDDAMLIAFALDGGWSREVDASGMLELAKSYCEIVSAIPVDEPQSKGR